MRTLSIIIVNWNVRKLLERCIRSIERYKGDIDLDVFVVDNASTDGSWDWLVYYETNTQKNPQHPLYGRFTFIANKKNVGFAAANNQAIQKTRAEYIYCLNPDTEIRDDTLSTLITVMDHRSTCGVLGSKIVFPDASTQPSVRRFPDWLSPTLISLGLTTKRVQRYECIAFDYEQEQQVDQVMGASFLIRRKLIQEIGMFDEGFFLWFEEVDFCRRSKEAGWEVWYTPRTYIVHHGGKSFSQALTLRKQKIFFQSLLYYFRKHNMWSAWALNIIVYPLRICVAAVMSLFQIGRKRRM